MEIHTIGIDLGKTVFHLVGLNPRGEVVVAQEVLAESDFALHGELACLLDWYGGLWRRLNFWAVLCANRGMMCV